MRTLIVNADDFNLTPGVNRAILKCHDSGILSSTTFMANLPIDEKGVLELKKRKDLGVGIHLNVTLKKPLSRPDKVRSLLAQDGNFRKVKEQAGGRLPEMQELVLEYATQVEFFKKIFGRLPTHFDTHHHMHAHPHFLAALVQTARYYKLPIRRSSLVPRPEFRKAGVRTPDHFFGNLSPEGYWRPAELECLLKNLPEGVSEIMCHPGIIDGELKNITSFTTGRAHELAVFSSPKYRKLLSQGSVRLAHYGLCYN